MQFIKNDQIMEVGQFNERHHFTECGKFNEGYQISEEEDEISYRGKFSEGGKYRDIDEFNVWPNVTSFS